MPKIYTRSGDDGETALLGGVRVMKDDLRIEAIGATDELNAALGVARMELARGSAAPPELDRGLAQIQHQLFDLGAELATPPSIQRAGSSPTPPTRAPAITDFYVRDIENRIDHCEASLQPLRAFILPGGSPTAAQLHFARCVARRCERRLVQLASREPIRPEILRYINRLSDWLFVAARAANQAANIPDVIWQQGASSENAPPNEN